MSMGFWKIPYLIEFLSLQFSNMISTTGAQGTRFHHPGEGKHPSLGIEPTVMIVTLLSCYQLFREKRGLWRQRNSELGLY